MRVDKQNMYPLYIILARARPQTLSGSAKLDKTLIRGSHIETTNMDTWTHDYTTHRAAERPPLPSATLHGIWPPHCRSSLALRPLQLEPEPAEEGEEAPSSRSPALPRSTAWRSWPT